MFLQTFITIAALTASTLVSARVAIPHTAQIEEARSHQRISPQTLLIKVLDVERFESENQNLGVFTEFLETENGTWGYFPLHMLPDAKNANLILEDLSRSPNLIEAYYEPLAQNASFIEKEIDQIEETSEATPNFEDSQEYLLDAPRGVGARSAWKQKGGTGKNVKIIDIETCFEDHHEDFKPAFFTGGNPKCNDTGHGTAVWGEIAAKNDGKGITGIAHGARFGIYGFIEGDLDNVNRAYLTRVNEAIEAATQELEAGDVMVIEQQMVGPDLEKYTAIEYWPHIFDHLKKATKKGIICVAAAGNGDSNLDHASYKDAFNLKKKDSGCIIVGAVAKNDRDRLNFSNYGSRLDAAAFGKNVVSAGYGDLFNGGKTRMYTKTFGGTSSATPMVAGAVAVVSSIAKENGITITPLEMRDALRSSGSPQGKSSIKKRTGSVPSIQALLERFAL